MATESGDRKGRVVLITGSVGCGKSTFINKVLIEAKQKNIKKLNYLIIDLINEFDDTPESINDFLWKEIDKKWRESCPEAYEHETLRKIFARELQTLRKGSYAKVFEQDQQLLVIKEAELLESLSVSPHDFLEKSWRYDVSQNKKGVVVFLDNIDRTSDRYQRMVYTFAHKLASQTGSTVIITMREGTYFRGRESGFLDIRSDDIVYHLQTPDLVQILSKRIEYIETLETPKEADIKEKDHRLTKWRNQPDWSGFYQSALQYTKVIKSTFLTTNANQFLNLLSAISWHNVRYFLDILRDLHLTLGSELEAWSSSYIISALLSANSITGGKSFLPNLYYPVYQSYPCYFLKIRLLLRLMYGKHNSELRRGTPLQTILNFTRMYAYLERWTRLAIKEMVRERLIECMEIPAEADFTKNYELEEFHSFRASPLAIVMLKQVYSDSIYLSMIGHELPFHKTHIFEKFISAVRDIITMISEEKLNKSGVDLLSETQSYAIVARYLVEMVEEEKPIGDVLTYFPEVSKTETKLRDIIAELLNVSGVSLPSHVSKIVYITPETNKQEDKEIQLSIFGDDEKSQLLQETNDIQVPHELIDIQTAPRDLAPKIFWALVQLRARGNKQCTGSEIATIINEYLTDDINKVEPTNVSKALRGKALQSQSWLKTDQIAPRKKLYGLSDGWRSYWAQIFKEEIPKLDE